MRCRTCGHVYGGVSIPLPLQIALACTVIGLIALILVASRSTCPNCGRLN